MTKPDGNALEAYIRLRQSHIQQSLPALMAEIKQTENEIAELQTTLARERSLAILRSQGLLFAWAYARVQAHQELAYLARQPWFKEAGLTANGKALHLIARLEGNPGQLILDLYPLDLPAVIICHPAGMDSQISPLFLTLLGGFVAEGRLVDVVVACAQRQELALDQRPSEERTRISDDVSLAYLRLRAAWISRPSSLETVDSEDPEVIQARLDTLYRGLFILGRQVEELTAQAQDARRNQEYEQEFEALLRLPEVKSLVASGQVVLVETRDIYIDQTLIGQFRLSFDFGAKTIQLTNLSRPRYSDDYRFDHPHVKDGSGCFGNIQSAVAEFLVSRDLPRLLPLTLDFLKSYNSANPFKKIEEWMY